MFFEMPKTGREAARPRLHGCAVGSFFRTRKGDKKCLSDWSSVVCCFVPSRRRHTRCLSDWSSDVCSSDLKWPLVGKFLSLFAATAVNAESLQGRYPQLATARLQTT